MRILFVTNPFKSHLFVQVPLAWALRAAGHDVCVAAPPNVADDVAHTGLPGISIGEDHSVERRMVDVDPVGPEKGPIDANGRRTGKTVQADFAWGDPHFELWQHATGVRQVFFPDATFDELVDFARGWRPELVISDPTAFPAGVAARVVGAAHARMLFGVDRLVQLRLANRAVPGAGDPFQDWMEPILQRYGYPFDEAAVIGQWSISPMPTWIWRPDAGVHYLPMRHLPYNGPSTIPAWLLEPPARRRVCITMGMSHRDANVRALGAGPSARELFDAVADLDVEVIATLDARQLGANATLPDNVRAVTFVPLNSLLPSCSAIVHSGGAGTFAAALEHGVPQIIVPHDFRTGNWWGPVAMANGLESRGAGVYAANAHSLTADGLRDSLKLVLEDSAIAANAAQVRIEVRAMPSPSEIVPVLEKLTAEYRR